MKPSLSIFNHPDYSALNVEGEQHYWRYEHRIGERLIGTLAGVFDGGRFVSGFSAPFGGIDLARERENPAVVAELVMAATEALARKGPRRILIRAKPMAYSEDEPAIHTALYRGGYGLAGSNLSFHVDLRRYADSAAYAEALLSDARRHVRRGLGREHEFRLAGTPEAEAAAYRVLEENRQARGWKLKLPYEYLAELAERFPDRIRYFMLSLQRQPTAVALVYRVARGRSLVVYWGHRPGSEAMAPMNLLAYHLVGRLKREGDVILDLGTASEDGVPIEGLAAFKRSLLGETSLRLDYVREV